jgi:hypothetical protein
VPSPYAAAVERLPLHLAADDPHLTRSSLHRCLQPHGISRLTALEGDAAENKRFKVYSIGYFHIDIAEVRTRERKLHLYVGIDRTSKFAFAQLHEKADRPNAVLFLEALLEAVPYDLHTILTDNPVLSDCRRQAVEGGSSMGLRRATMVASSSLHALRRDRGADR